MKCLDELHTRWPFLGQRKLIRELRDQGIEIGRKRLRRLMKTMGIEAIAPKPQLSASRPRGLQQTRLLCPDRRARWF